MNERLQIRRVPERSCLDGSPDRLSAQLRRRERNMDLLRKREAVLQRVCGQRRADVGTHESDQLFALRRLSFHQ